MQEEEARARANAASPRQFQQQVEAALKKAFSYEDELSQGIALSIMDLDSLQARAEEAASLSHALGEQPRLSTEDALALELLTWFKQSFFVWIDSPPCRLCGNQTAFVNLTLPSLEEAAHGAVRTELYRCIVCHQQATRFPRVSS